MIAYLLTESEDGMSLKDLLVDLILALLPVAVLFTTLVLLS